MYTETTNERVSGRDGGATERGLKCCQRTPRGGQHSYVPGIRLALHNTAQVSYWYWYLVSISPQFAIFAIFALARGKFDRLPGISIMFYVPACNLWAERRWEKQLRDVIARFAGWIYVRPPVTLCYRHCWQIQIIPLPGSSQQWSHNRRELPLANTKRSLTSNRAGGKPGPRLIFELQLPRYWHTWNRCQALSYSPKLAKAECAATLRIFP